MDSSKRSTSRKYKHHDHFYQRLAGGSSKPVKTASMLAMMICSPFFIIFMQVFLALPPPSLLHGSSHALSFIALLPSFYLDLSASEHVIYL